MMTALENPVSSELTNMEGFREGLAHAIFSSCPGRAKSRDRVLFSRTLLRRTRELFWIEALLNYFLFTSLLLNTASAESTVT